ncbi:MAG TPA: winged helix-turn-helix transcriptional regulator, partial [Syntrophaceticus sp.]|nr:winged helix-turn-helix transcriptional regulator [Syntrophaceticus sp.]
MAYLTKREKEILAHLKKDPTISQEELAKKLQITRSAAAVHISNLMRKGFILGRGYILDERSGILIAGKAWLEISAQVEDSTIDLYCGGIGFCWLRNWPSRSWHQPYLPYWVRMMWGIIFT